MAARNPQLKLLKNGKDEYGGSLRCTRAGRVGSRPLSTRETMHMVLRSSKATGDWSFKKQKNEQKIKEIVARIAHKFGVRILSLGIVGNHLHFHLKLGNRFAYKPFVRGLTASITMAVTGVNRWTRVKGVGGKGCESGSERFWDLRPFTRVVRGLKALLTLRDYIQLNQIEGYGVKREEARFINADMNRRPWAYESGP
ncbi:MAG: transposase [Bdellovibrionia bacterium]